MSGETKVLRRIEWAEICPWLMIFRVFRLATSFPILLLATVGVLLTPLGWLVADRCLSETDQSQPSLVNSIEMKHGWLDVEPPEQMGQGSSGFMPGSVIPRSISEFTRPIQQPYRQMVTPFFRLFQRDTPARPFFYSLIGGLWMLLVWAPLGGAISRVAVVRLGRGEREGLGAALRFALRRFVSYFTCPLFAMSGVMVIAVVASLVGLAMRLDAGVLAAAVVWIFVLLGGLLATVLLLGLLFGWPLMWAAISTEEMGDIFEAAQRGYSFTFGRPIHYLFYVAVAMLVGSVGFWVVQCFAAMVIELSYWSVSWGAGNERLQAIATSTSGIAGMGNLAIQVINGGVWAIASAFKYSFFWCALAAIYLLLRRDVDRTNIDDVYVLDEEQRYGLPPLVTDEAGVPGVAEENGQETAEPETKS